MSNCLLLKLLVLYTIPALHDLNHLNMGGHY